MTETPAFTIMLPVNRPPDLMGHAVRSVLGQSRQDFELLIICDGAPAATAQAARRFEAEDGRIRAFVHPKGQRNGEAWRHAALQAARGRIVCQIGDDDLWFPDHLATAEAMLETADFGHTLPLYVDGAGTAQLHMGDLADPVVRRQMAGGAHNLFGPTVSAYRLETYRALPEGWTPAPEGVWSDLWMWRKFLALPGVRLRTWFAATAVTFPAALRRGWSLERRGAEIQAAAVAIRDPARRDGLWRDALRNTAREEVSLRTRAQEMQVTGRRLVKALDDAQEALGGVVAARGNTDAQAALAAAALAASPDRGWLRGLLVPPEPGKAEAGTASPGAAGPARAPDPAAQGAEPSPVTATDPSFETALELLAEGRYAEAWPHWRLRPPRLESPFHTVDIAEWQGEPLAGKRIVLVAEQGLGDEVMLSRYVPLVRALGPAHLTLACDPLNIPAFAHLGADEVICRRTTSYLPPTHYWAQLGSLPEVFGTTLQTIPPPAPPPVTRRRGRIGLVTAGNPGHPHDAHRSLPFDPDLPGVERLTPAGDMLASFEQVAGLDLLITVDTAWAHIAGTLGVPTWLMLPVLGLDWRWGREGSDTPWYPSMRLYRQPAPGDWASVIAEIRQDLDAFRATGRG